MTEPNATAWHTLSPEAAAGKLGVNLSTGLPAAEAQRRLQQYGPNKLTEKKRNRVGKNFCANTRILCKSSCWSLAWSA